MSGWHPLVESMVAVVLFISDGRHILLQSWPITGGKPLVEGGETKDLLVTGLVFFIFCLSLSFF